MATDDPTAPPAPEAEPGPPVRFQAGTPRFENVNDPGDGGPPAVDVPQLLRENVARAKAAGVNDLASKPPHCSRRRRDYWWLIIATNLLFGLVALAAGHASPLLCVGALTGMAVFSAALTWLMWFVMDDY
jgi:hypothetical protein